MIYFSFYEIARSLYFAVLLGVVLGVTYSVNGIIMRCFFDIQKMPSRLIHLCKDFKSAHFKSWFAEKRQGSLGVFIHISDFLFVFTAAVLISITLYITMDGVFRIYIPLIVVGTAYATNKLFGGILNSSVHAVLYIIYGSFVYSLAVFLLPFLKVINKINSLAVNKKTKMRKNKQTKV